MLGQINRFKFFAVRILLERNTLRTRLYGIKPVTLKHENKTRWTLFTFGMCRLHLLVLNQRLIIGWKLQIFNYSIPEQVRTDLIRALISSPEFRFIP